MGDCVEHYGDHAVGYITAPAKSDDGGDWLVQWVMYTDGSPHGVTHSTPWHNDPLRHYLKPGDKVKLLPIEDIWPEHLDRANVGRLVELAACSYRDLRGRTVTIYPQTPALPCVCFGPPQGQTWWPLSRVRKVT